MNDEYIYPNKEALLHDLQPGAPLSDYAEYIRRKLNSLRLTPFRLIRVSFDETPPIVETVYRVPGIIVWLALLLAGSFYLVLR